MELSYLREYIELVRSLNYTTAAKKMHVTQPTLSKHVVAIEKELGCKLFERDRRKVEPTDAGRVFASAAIQMIEAYDEAQVKISEIEKRNPLRVDGTVFDNAMSSIFSIASTFLDNEGYPPVNYTHHADVDCIELLMAGEIDVACTFYPKDELETMGLSYIPMTRSRFVALMRPDNPLAQKQTLTMDQLRNSRLIKFVDSYAIHGWQNIENVCHNHGFTPRTRTVLGRNKTNYFTTSLDEDEVIILQASTPQLRYLSDYSRFVTLSIEDDDAVFHLYAVYKTDDYERVKFLLDAYAQARKIILNHGINNGSMLVNH